MGNFYVNLSVKDAEPRQVVESLERAKRRAIVTPTQGGYVVVYDEEADSQAIEPLLEVGSLLSRELGRTVLAVLDHDDDILCYWLFDRGELADSYNSNPNYFDGLGEQPEEEEASLARGDSEKLCALLKPDAEAAAVETILREDFAFAFERHEKLAEALGLPLWSVGLGYRYVEQGDLPDDMDVERLIHVGRRDS